MNRLRRIACAALCMLCCAAPGLAQDSLETAKRRELDEINRAARENREKATQLKGKETQAVSQLRRTERDLNVTRKRLRTLQTRQRKLDQQLDVTRVNLERSILSLEQQRQKLGQRLRALYKAGGGSDLEFMLSSQSFGQLLARWDYTVMVAEQDRVMLEDYRGRKDQVEADKQRLEINLTEVGRNTKKTGQQNERLAELRSERAGTVKTIQTQRQAYEAAAVQLEKTARSIRTLLATLERKRKEEADRAKAAGRVPQPYAGDFASGQGRLEWPVRGTVIGQFGNEVHPKWGTVTPNNGIDIESPIGTPVRVVAKGRVDYVSDDYGTYGQMILVNHGDSYFTLYGHLSSIDVSVGQEVATGQTIGRSGDSGSLKGAVLHFEVRKGGAAMNPADWLN